MEDCRFDMLRAKVIKNVEGTGLVKELGIRLDIPEPGRCMGTMMLNEKHINAINVIHGGASFSLADTVAGIAAASYGKRVLTLGSSFNYLRAGRDCKLLRCTAHVLSYDEEVMLSEASVVNERDEEICKGLFQYFVIGKLE